MYAYISGTLAELQPDAVVVENGGIGYNIHIPSRIMEELPGVGERVKIYTYLYVREDALLLYGFPAKDEVELFRQLINVSGIGPKGALSILSVMSPDDVRFAVMNEDDKAFAKAPGVGKKTAQRLIIELKDKVQLEDTAYGQEFLRADQDKQPADGRMRARTEAIEALTALGYSASEAAKAVRGVSADEDTDTGTILKEALKQMTLI